MKFWIDDQGIHFYEIQEPQPIDDAEAVRIVERIAAKERKDLERCLNDSGNASPVALLEQ